MVLGGLPATPGQAIRTTSTTPLQATFLVFARKAEDRSRRPDRLGPWLYRVTRTVAHRARLGAARRRACEAKAATPSQASHEPPEADDVRPLLHDEIDRLPASYRSAVVLCYLQGQTHEEAAHRLNWPVGTVRGRLARARSLLRDRLTRRGVTLSAGLSTLAILEGTSSAAVPSSLMTSALGLALGGAMKADRIEVHAVRLAGEVVGGILMAKIKAVAAVGMVALVGTLIVARATGGPFQDRAKAGLRTLRRPKLRLRRRAKRETSTRRSLN